jgi:hypothetical protein
MKELKYLVLITLIYIIFRIFYNTFNKNPSETYTQITNNIKILYENLIRTPSTSSIKTPSLSTNLTPSLSNVIKSYKAYLNSPSRTIDVAITLPSGIVTTIPCKGNCVNCVIDRLTPSGCSVKEKI